MDVNVDEIKRELECYNPKVIYLFGSAARNELREDSDIDIAFLGKLNLNEYDIFMKAQELAFLLKRDVDLIDLRKASTVFKKEVVEKGKVISCNDNNERMLFEMRTLKEYAMLNEERNEIIKNIRERGSVYGNGYNFK